MNDPEFQKRVLDLCDAAMECEPVKREQFLASACAGDRALHAAVATVIRAVDDPDNFISAPQDDVEYAPGDRIGVYRIVAEIGSGGMGTVYEAERNDAGFTQRVALKIVRTHVLSVEMIARFNEERRILASVSHPYIAGLIDGGTTDDGRPYLVMELIDGLPIDEYCDANRLSVNDRVWLVQKVAMAIQAAHQNLVVHRDLKPSNILICEGGIPKLLDFGIAVLLGSGREDGAPRPPAYRTRALTPDYASPEQITDGVVTTASDVFSLGVLTYKLLIGTTPYAIGTLTHREMSASVDKMTIPPASARVTRTRSAEAVNALAMKRSVSPRKLARQLVGDLDAVLAKALHKDPGQRYPSAAAFAADLERYGKGLTVEARGTSRGYRLRRFVARNRLTVGASSAALIALCVGLGVSLWQAHEAKNRFDDLHQLAETVIYDLHDAIADLPGSTPARELIASEALHYLDRLAGDAAGDRRLQADLAAAYKRVGDVLGLPSNANLGDSEGALASYVKALTIADRLSRGVALDPDIERTKAVVREKMAEVQAWRGQVDEALEHSAASLDIFARLAERHGDDAATLSVAISHVKRGDLLGNPNFPNAGDHSGSTQQYLLALDTIGRVAVRDERADRYLALIHERLGTMSVLQGDADTALTHFVTSRDLREMLSAAHPQQLNMRRDVGIAHEKIADMQLQAGASEEALGNYRTALEIYRDLADADPDNTNAARTLAIGLENVSEALLAMGDRATARDHYLDSVRIRQSLVARDPGNTRFATELQRVVARLDDL